LNGFVRAVLGIDLNDPKSIQSALSGSLGKKSRLDAYRQRRVLDAFRRNKSA
jgi:hypothetical protein